MEDTILVKSSSRNEPYTVAVLLSETGLSITCSCPAGTLGKYCKHKIAVVLADEEILYDVDQNDGFQKAKVLISESSYPMLIEELRASEKNLEAAKKSVENNKQRIARSMKEGLKL